MLVKELVYWITQREVMRMHKESGGKFPHHPDPRMANNRYTNVRREDDKVTKWLADNWRTPHWDSPVLTRAMCLARMVNYIPTLELIPFPDPWNTEEVTDILDECVSRGGKTWSSAYMITTCGKNMNKVDYVVDHVCSRVPEVTKCESLKDAYKELRTVDGLGSFLAGQILADLKNTPGNSLFNAPDWDTWSAPGPGSLRGLSYFFERSITASTYYPAIRDAWNAVKYQLPVELQDLHMQDFQNCLCEFSKFMRGYGRNSYKG
jgi:hypothetical protein